jgi:hypothetical protein
MVMSGDESEIVARMVDRDLLRAEGSKRQRISEAWHMLLYHSRSTTLHRARWSGR